MRRIKNTTMRRLNWRLVDLTRNTPAKIIYNVDNSPFSDDDWRTIIGGIWGRDIPLGSLEDFLLQVNVDENFVPDDCGKYLTRTTTSDSIGKWKSYCHSVWRLLLDYFWA